MGRAREGGKVFGVSNCVISNYTREGRKKGKNPERAARFKSGLVLWTERADVLWECLTYVAREGEGVGPSSGRQYAASGEWKRIPVELSER